MDDLPTLADELLGPHQELTGDTGAAGDEDEDGSGRRRGGRGRRG